MLIKQLKVCLGVIYLSILSLPAYAEKVSISTGEFAPLYSEHLKSYGLIPHIVEQAFAASGVDVIYSVTPWSRAARLVKYGSVDASCCWFEQSDRKEFSYYSAPVYTYEYSFFHLHSFPFDWRQIDDLKGLKIGATHEYTYTKAFTEAENSALLSIERVPSDKLNYRKLLKGRIDIFPMNKISGYYLINKEFNAEERMLFTHHSKPLFENNVHLIFSKLDGDRAKKLVKLFNEGLENIRRNGIYDRIISDFNRGYYTDN